MSAKATEYVYSTVMIVVFALGMGGAIATVQSDVFSTTSAQIEAARIGETR